MKTIVLASKRIVWSTILLVLPLIFNTTSFCQILPADFSKVRVASKLSNPTALAFTPDGRIFIALQTGVVRLVVNDTLAKKSFYEMAVDSRGERGLIGMSIDPNFPENHYLYLYHTLPDGSNNRITRITAGDSEAIAGSEQLILDLSPLTPTAYNHNGGAMHFKDGKLYVSIGENGTKTRAQNLDTYHGKILRINPDGSAPDDNPFPSGSEPRRRIWDYGFRNPFTFDIQPGTGRIFVNDVGQHLREEINDATSGGKNFGWPLAEGPSTRPGLVNPVFYYLHGTGVFKGCAITGGTFFNPDSTSYPSEYLGRYFYLDFCNNWINMLTLTDSSVVNDSFGKGMGHSNVGLTTGPDGNLYYLERGTATSSGFLNKIIYNKAPEIVEQPSSDTALQRHAKTFSVNVVGTATLHYQWKKNNVDIADATFPSYTIEKVALSDSGFYSVLISNTAGHVQSTAAKLTVIAVDAPPIVNIITPSATDHYRANDTIVYSGEALDEEDGVLPDSVFKWSVSFYHGGLISDGPTLLQGVRTGAFAIAVNNDTSLNVFYRLHLKVHDSKDSIREAWRDILPYTSVVRLVTEPPGLQLTMNGDTVSTPVSITVVQHMPRTIGVITPQISGSDVYQFDHWSQGGDAVQTFFVTDADTTLSAVFSKIPVTAVEEYSHLFSVFPNPANNQIIIQLKTEYRPVAVSLTDMAGRPILKVNSGNKSNIIIDTSEINSGIYLLKFQQGKKFYNKVVAITR